MLARNEAKHVRLGRTKAKRPCTAIGLRMATRSVTLLARSGAAPSQEPSQEPSQVRTEVDLSNIIKEPRQRHSPKSYNRSYNKWEAKAKVLLDREESKLRKQGMVLSEEQRLVAMDRFIAKYTGLDMKSVDVGDVTRIYALYPSLGRWLPHAEISESAILGAGKGLKTPSWVEKGEEHHPWLTGQIMGVYAGLVALRRDDMPVDAQEGAYVVETVLPGGTTVFVDGMQPVQPADKLRALPRQGAGRSSDVHEFHKWSCSAVRFVHMANGANGKVHANAVLQWTLQLELTCCLLQRGMEVIWDYGSPYWSKKA